jgi:hypothetical protein
VCVAGAQLALSPASDIAPLCCREDRWPRPNIALLKGAPRMGAPRMKPALPLCVSAGRCKGGAAHGGASPTQLREFCAGQGLHLDKAAARLEQAGPKHSPRAPRLADTAEGRAFGYLSLRALFLAKPTPFGYLSLLRWETCARLEYS